MVADSWRFLISMFVLFGISSCARGDEGSSFERPQTFIAGENDSAFVAAQDITLTPDQTVFVFTESADVTRSAGNFGVFGGLTSRPGDALRQLIACNFGPADSLVLRAKFIFSAQNSSTQRLFARMRLAFLRIPSFLFERTWVSGSPSCSV